MIGDKTLSQDIYDVCQMVINNPDDLDADDIMDYIICNFDLAEIDFIIEVLDNVDVVKVREGLRDHIQAYIDSVTMERDLGAIVYTKRNAMLFNAIQISKRWYDGAGDDEEGDEGLVATFKFNK